MFVFPFIIILSPRCCGSTLYAALKSLALKFILKAEVIKPNFGEIVASGST